MIFTTYSNSRKKIGGIAMLLTRAIFGFFFFVIVAAVHAAEGDVIGDIRLTGLQRTDPGVIFSKIPLSVGGVFDEKGISDTIKVLFKLGYFSDVEVSRDEDTLVINVRERPAIASISFYGIKEFKDEQLKAALEQIGLKEGNILDAAGFDLATQELKNAYLSRGKYGVEISSTITPLERNRVGISFNVFEGKTAEISDIQFFGNHSFSRDELLKQMTLSPPSGFFRGEKYSRVKLEADVEIIRSFYLDQGFINFEIISTQVSVNPNKDGISITISLAEGERFAFGDISFSGDRVVPHEELTRFIEITPGDVFSRSVVNQLTNEISDRLGDDGYANASVRAIPQLDLEKKRVSFSIHVDAGRRVYVRRINISGNESTRGDVIRRELRQLEGEWYSLKKINRSKQRLDLTGFFSSVEIRSTPLSGVPDSVDLDVKVVERKTGSFQIGIGYSSEDRALFTTSLSNDNIFGSGNSLTLDVSSGSVNEKYSVKYKNPYVNDYGFSRSIDFYSKQTDYSSLDVSTYSDNSFGVSIDYGIPLSEFDKIFVGGGYEESDLTLGADAPSQYSDFVNLNGNVNVIVPINVGWSRDRRDSAIIPSSGTYQGLYTTYATPAGDLGFYSLSYDVKSYYSLGKFTTLVTSGRVSYADDYGGDQLPFYKNFYAGGASTIRGYKSSSMGPKGSDGTALGAKRRLLTSLEILTPIPTIKDDRSMRLSAFMDAGGLENSFDDLFADYRYSLGVGFNWYSPVGPMRFSFARPLNSKSSDKTETFQFTLGGLF
jgi:outer membrane protein insertion porin family